MDTLGGRWAKLYPHVLQFGPSDDLPRPAVLMFPGCGDVRKHHMAYVKAAVRAGWRAFLISSHAPRGWSKRFAATFVCTGALLRGDKRAGDVLASVWGVSQLPGVDPERLALAGWSHGGWSIMDLMTMPLARRGEAGLSDPDPRWLSGVERLFLGYPYVGVLARSARRPWLRAPRTFGVVPRRDHMATVRTHMKVYAAPVAAGVDLELWSPDATHAFDEPGIRAPVPVEFDPDLQAEAVRRFEVFLRA